MTPAQREAWERDGVLIVQDVVPPETLAAVRAEYEAVMDGLWSEWSVEGVVDDDPGTFEARVREANRRGLDWFQPLDISLPMERVTPVTPMHFGPAVFDLLTCPAILDLAEAVIGSELTSNPIQHVRIKPPVAELHEGDMRAHVAGTSWHQDRGVTHEEADETDIVTIWIAVTDATVENGCLQAVPGLAGRGMLPHCPYRQTEIARGHLDGTPVPLPVKAGGVVMLHPLIPHSSLPNVSNGIRWSFDIRYSRTGQPTGRSHFPDFVARSRSNPASELKDWRTWLRMWEDARMAAAASPHIELHRWTAQAPYCA